MIRMLISVGLKLLANAVGLLVAAWVLEDMTLNGAAFVIALAIFTLALVILQLIVKIAMKHSQALMGGTALVSTLVGLILTTLISDGLSISGLTTWVLATLIVWLAAMLAGIILPALLLKKAIDNKGASPATRTFG
jgi:putative membrane protein